MNNAPIAIKNQCNNLLDWVEARGNLLVSDKYYVDMYALYMEWLVWVEDPNPSILVIGIFDEEM